MQEGHKDNLKAEVYAEEILLKGLEENQDEDGYIIGDPYAEQAKKIDR